MNRPGERERGAASIELTLATPLLLLMLLAIVQFAIWSHATHIAQAAASEGLAAARVHGGGVAQGDLAARRILAQLAEGPLTHGDVVVHRDTAVASVRISGRAAVVVPFL